MNKFLIPVLLVCCMGAAMAQSPAPASTDAQNKDKGDVIAVNDDRPVNAFCPQTGSMIKRNVDHRAARAVDCAGASPGQTYTRKDIDSTGALTTAQALEQLDPAVRIHR